MNSTIYLKGVTDYLTELVELPKNVAFEISSRINLNNLNECSYLEIENFLDPSDIQKLESKIKNYPLKTSSFILGLDFSFGLLESILRHYGKSDRLVDLVIENPYTLLDVEEITFNKIDKIAQEVFKIPQDSPLRQRAFVIYHLNTICFKEGHLFISIEKFFNVEIDIPSKDLKSYLRELITEKKIIFENGNLYPALNYKAEVESARLLANLIKLKNTTTFFNELNVETYIKDYEDSQTQNILNGCWKKLKWANNKFELSEEQKTAIRKFFTERFFVITGLPGTGKTTCLKALVDISRNRNLKILLMTPTGVSAKRLSDICDHEAFTIHKALGFDGVQWKKDSQNRLDSDIIIIDEFSMVDQILLYRLLSALPDKEFILVFVGDAAQIPPVGPGDTLHNLINNKHISHIKLTQIFRQKDTSEIVLNAHFINQGNVNLVGKKDFFFIQIDDQHQILDALIKIVEKYKDEDFQILSPTYKNLLGVTNLNNVFRDLLNPCPEDNSVTLRYRVNDRIMIIKNDYKNEIYNGECGIVSEIKKSFKRVAITMNSGKDIEYSFKDVYSMINLNYCRTIHRAQSQEYDIVVLPYIRQFSIQLQRNLLYTAVTRAKHKVFIVGHYDALVKSIKNKYMQKRNTNFPNRLNYFLT